VLTTQEVYAKCIDSVVSISVTMDGGAASGSGFIISEDGYIVTAAHVVDGATAVKVILNNDEIINATVVGADNYTDVALLKVEKSGLTPIAIGKSNDLLVGDDVLAIGTPASLEYNGSLSYGKVSYLNRRMKIYDDYGNTEKVMTVIQTSALVNSGNSGCPLINDRGEAVGIVVMKLKSTYFEGMGFALPLDAAMPIIEAMKASEDYTALQSAISEKPAVLGVTISAVRINALDVYGLQIDSFSDADLDVKSKMKVGDVITHVDGVAVSGRSDMRYILDRRAPGDKIAVTFYRGYQSMTVEVVLGS
jgi:serine protease Do